VILDSDASESLNNDHIVFLNPRKSMEVILRQWGNSTVAVPTQAKLTPWDSAKPLEQGNWSSKFFDQSSMASDAFDPAIGDQ
jgi:hypothetical protein